MSASVIGGRAAARVCSFLLVFLFSSAQAASITYVLDQSNDLPDGVDYLSVTVADSITQAGAIDFTVDVIAASLPEPGPNFGIQSFYFNVDDGLAVAPSNIVNIDPDAWSVGENRNAGGGFGKFDFFVKGSGNNRTDSLSFTIDGVDGDTVASYAFGSSLLPNSGQFFAAHVAGFSGDPYGVTSAKFAGLTATVIPLPAAFWLFLSALGLLVRVR